MTSDSDSSAPREPAESTHFAFQHRVFSVPGSYFAKSDGNGEPTFFVPLGDMRGVLSFPALIAGFDIKTESDDAKLLDTVAKGLAYVRTIHPGDSIPRELLDGTASWAVDDRHHKIAAGRLAAHLLAWASGTTAATKDTAQFAAVADDAATRAKLQETSGTLADKLGLGRNRAAEIVARTTRLGRELSYIEALHDRLGAMKAIVLKINQVTTLYGAERSQSEEAGRIIVLMRKPIGEYEHIFADIDTRLADIVTVFRDVDEQIEILRVVRDELHRRFMLWDDLVRRWQPFTVTMTAETDTLLRDTYRFMAHHFSQAATWDLQFAAPRKPRK